MQSSIRDGTGSGLGERRSPGPGERRREGTEGRIVYPVVSRRSGGLSLGVDLFPDAKSCNFDCPYCEVFLPSRESGSPLAESEGFSPAGLEEELGEFLRAAYAREWASERIRDICISGSGEPTSSPFLREALETCARARREHPALLGSSTLVLITNSTGFLESATSDLLLRAARDEGLVVWAKLDAGSEELFGLMSGSKERLERVAEGILSFSRRASIVVQTMLCEVEGRSPSDADMDDYCRLLSRLLSDGARVGEAHLYTFARPTPHHACAPLSDERLIDCAEAVRARTGLRVRAFGLRAELFSKAAEAVDSVSSASPKPAELGRPDPASPASPKPAGLGRPDPASPASPKPAGLRRINPEGIDP